MRRKTETIFSKDWAGKRIGCRGEWERLHSPEDTGLSGCVIFICSCLGFEVLSAANRGEVA
ncbi:MAG TPA: hypothetical protein DDY32_10980 [Desulfobulbaceae bacterium]|nr:hypothetical protein [Desulfobulbaceae bacterium]